MNVAIVGSGNSGSRYVMSEVLELLEINNDLIFTSESLGIQVFFSNGNIMKKQLTSGLVPSLLVLDKSLIKVSDFVIENKTTSLEKALSSKKKYPGCSVYYFNDQNIRVDVDKHEDIIDIISSENDLRRSWYIDYTKMIDQYHAISNPEKPSAVLVDTTRDGDYPVTLEGEETPRKCLVIATGSTTVLEAYVAQLVADDVVENGTLVIKEDEDAFISKYASFNIKEYNGKLYRLSDIDEAILAKNRVVSKYQKVSNQLQAFISESNDSEDNEALLASKTYVEAQIEKIKAEELVIEYLSVLKDETE